MIMQAQPLPPEDDPSFFNLKQAKWVVGILGFLIGVVGKESLVGLILRQSRAEIVSLVRGEEQGQAKQTKLAA
jgi:hypothetical protein